MAKQLNVEMNFTADTSQVKQQLQQLKITLDDLTSGKSLNFKETPLTKSLQESLNAASKLKAVLNEATNASTGKLDLTSFTRGMNNAGLKVQDVKKHLLSLGPEGTQAFIQMARSVQQADGPLVRVNQKLGSMLTTLKNTAKWQISSSLLHGFMSAVSGAYGYAQDLNESLNNIRIVTGQSVDQMAKFANEANNAAKALSSTTKEYTDASLIYYQQGLNDEQVKERTDVTVKMANVTRDSAETVSQQLTAVWNNFDDGSQKLEYYADVMTALGAATASSSDEIATGVQKFASVAKTAGLSYEYAASALATITATTRQSADTVGTGLRTVLARIEALNLGETLEDGVGLTKYTKALESIGVQVLDTNGQLKAADTILDEMAAKWQNLSEAQKMATAETVGGVRQYTTIMSLMENWDFMQENVAVARGSEGTLQEQADIYAESWEAASKRVKTAAQAIYTDLINDDFFITILDGAEKILTFIDNLIDSLGGLPGLLSTISTIVFRLFGPQIANSMTNMAQTISLLTPKGQQKMEDWRNAFINQGSSVAVQSDTYENQALTSTLDLESDIQKAINENASKFSEEQQKQIANRQQMIELGNTLATQEAQKLDALKQESEFLKNKILTKTDDENKYDQYDNLKGLEERVRLEQGTYDERVSKVNNLFNADSEQKISQIRESVKSLGMELGVSQEQFNELFTSLKSSGDTEDFASKIKEELKEMSPAAQQAIKEITLIFDKLQNTNGNKLVKNFIPDEELKNSLNNLKLAYQQIKENNINVDMEKVAQTSQDASSEISHYIAILEQLISGEQRFNQQMDLNEKAAYELIDALNQAPPFSNWATNFVQIAQGISTVSMGINSAIGSISTFVNGVKEGNLTLSQMLGILGSLAMSATMVLPQLISGFQALTTTLLTSATTRGLMTTLIQKENAEKLKEIAVNALVAKTEDESKKSKLAKIGADIAEAVATGVLDKEKKQELITRIANTLGIKEETAAKILDLIATKLLTAATAKYLIIAAAAIAVIAGLIILISKLVVTQKEASEAIQKSTEAYQEEKDKLDELNSALKETQNRIKELNDQDTLTLVEQSELKQLKNREELLKKQIQLQELLVKAKQAEQAQTIAENFKTSAQLSGPAYKDAGSYYAAQYIDKDQVEENYNKAYQEYLDTGDETKWKQAQATYESMQNMLKEIDEASEQQIIDNADQIQTNEENFIAYLEALQNGAISYNKDTLAEIVNSIAEGRKLLAGSVEEYQTQVLQEVANNQSLDTSGIFKDALSGPLEENDVASISRQLLEMGIPIQDFLDSVNNQVAAFKDQFKDTTEVDKFLEKIPEEDIPLALTLNVDGTETVDELLQKFAALKEEVAGTQEELDKQTLKENYADNKKTAESVRDGTTNISADDWSKLPSYAQDYFQKMNDGTYELMGSAEDFYNLVMSKSKEAFAEEITSTRDRIQRLESIQNGNGEFTTRSAARELIDSGAASEEQVNDWRTQWQSGDPSQMKKAYEEFTAAAEEAGVSVNQLTEEYNNQIALLPSLQSQLATSCVNLNELDSLVQENHLLLQDGAVNVTAYCEGLIALGNNYESCAHEVQQMQFALASGNSELIDNAGIALKDAVAIEELAEAYELNADDIKDQAKAYQKANDSLKDNTKAAQKLSVLNQKMNEGVKDLHDNWSDWKKVLNSTDKTSMDYVNTMQDLEESVRDLLGASDDTIISTEFLEKNFDLIERAANGDVAAVDALGMALAQTTVESWNFADGMQMLNSQGNLFDTTLTNFNYYKNQVLEGITSLDEALANNAVSVGDNITSIMDGTGASWIDALNQMAIATGMSVGQMNSLLNQLGVQAKVEVHSVQQEMEVPTQEEVYLPAGQTPFTYSEIGEDGEQTEHTIYRPRIRKAVIPGAPIKTTGYVQVPQISTDGNPLTPDITYTGRGSAAPSSTGGGKGGGGGGGGGGSAPKKAKTQKVEPKKVDRYKEITDKIDDLGDAIEKTNTQSDRLWGKDRLTSMQQANKLLKEQIGAYKEKARQAAAFLEVDKKALNATLKARWTGEYENSEGNIERIQESFGNLEFKFDADGDISNYTEIMQKITDTYNARQRYWANPNNFADADAQSRYQDLYVKPMEEQLGLIEEAIKQYEETKGVWEENTEAAQEALREWQDNNLEQLEYKLELKVDVNESELEKIEYYIDKLSDDFYSMGENLANYMDKLDNTNDLINIYTNQINELNKAYAAGDISQEGYYEALKDINGEMYDQLETLKELDTTLREYFGETLDMGQEELEKYTDNLDHVNDMLDHYKNVMQLLGKETDYEMIGSFLDGIAKNSMNNYLAAKQYYDLLAVERSRLEDELAQLSVGTEEYRFKKQQLDDLVEAFNDAEDTMLDKAEEAAEAFASIWENTIESIKHQFEMLATNGLGFDFLNSSLERIESRQDEYLTKTNQLYEMNDLLRKLQADSDKTTNLAAKQRIANFSAEMEQLRDKNELSKLDLDIAKARYQQLLAQIALEEAQNAKSMVRLHRDNEGNYGYMYTADPDKLNEAEDALAKANNDLYNIVLEGTNKYSQLSLELTEQFINDRADLETQAREEGWFETERYYDSLLTLEKEYYAKAKAYATEYGTAYFWLDRLDVSTTGANEAYTQQHRDEILQAQNFFLDAINPAYKEMGQQMQDTTSGFVSNIQPLLEGPDSLSSSLGTVEDAVAENVERSNEWTEAVVGENGLVNALGNEFNDVLNKTNDYLKNHQAALYETIDAYEKLAEKISGVIAAQSALSEDDKITSEGLKSLAQEIYESITFQGYDTGGYTGSWGSSGKLALLHEKELVLNKQDTENLLLSVDILRRLSSALDLQAMSSGLASISSSATINAGSNNLQQDVTIHAEFPNAVDHTEIEMAFDTLINRASQYAGR